MDTPKLHQLMGAYFHQDWALDGDETAAVREFLSGEPGAADVADEIDRVLDAHASEAEVGALLRSLGSCYTPGEGGYRRWLESIARRARTM